MFEGKEFLWISVYEDVWSKTLVFTCNRKSVTLDFININFYLFQSDQSTGEVFDKMIQKFNDNFSFSEETEKKIIVDALWVLTLKKFLLFYYLVIVSISFFQIFNL